MKIKLKQTPEELSKALEIITSERDEITAILDNIFEGFITIDSNGRIISINRIACDFLNVDYRDTLGKAFTDLINNNLILKQLKEEFISRIFDLKTIEREAFEAEIIDNNNKLRHFEVFIKTLVHPRMIKRDKTLILFRDITEHKELEIIREDFISALTHDLKTPLTAILTVSEFIRDYNENDPFYKEYPIEDQVSFLQLSARLMDSKVNEVLAIARLESGKLLFQKTYFDLRDIVDEVLKITRPVFITKNIVIKTQFDGTGVVFADREKIFQVVLNLIDNSLKFTPQNGSIEIVVNEKDETVAFTIKDNGAGVKEEDLQRIFQKFSQAKGIKGGSGFGLYFVQKIIVGHGHDIKLTSKAGEGAEFTFLLDKKASE